MTIIASNSRTFASSRNAFWKGSADDRYALRISNDGSLQFQRGAGAWVPFDPQPPARPTHVAADNNRVFIRTADGGLHWTCLATDIASWVDFNFEVLRELLTSPPLSGILGDFQTEFGSLIDLDAMLRELAAVGDLDAGPASSLPDARDALIREWLSRYRSWLTSTHTVARDALHGPWSALRRPLADGPAFPGSSAVLDIAVGNWHHTVVTYYVLLADGRVAYLDEEPMMPRWNVIPGSRTADERREAGLTADPDSVLAASHSVVAILQPRDKSVVWRRFDYHNPEDFKLPPVVDWVERRWTRRALPVAEPEALALDAGYHGPGGRSPWPVPKPHALLSAITRHDEDALRLHIRDFQRLIPIFDVLFGLVPAGLRVAEILGRVAPEPEQEPEQEQEQAQEPKLPNDLFMRVKNSKAIANLLDEYRTIEATLFRLFDRRRLFTSPTHLHDRAAALAKQGASLPAIMIEIVGLASARIDALEDRDSEIGLFGDNPIRPVGAWPIDLWVRSRDGSHAHLCAAQARHAGELTRVEGVDVGVSAPPETGRLRWYWASVTRPRAGAGLGRRVRVELSDSLEASARYRWTISEHGEAPRVIEGTARSIALELRVDADEDPIIRVEGRDASGGRSHASTSVPLPRPSVTLRLQLADSTPHGGPRERHFSNASGSIVSAMTVTQQGYASLRVLVDADELGPGPVTIHWTASHHHRGSAVDVSLPHALDVSCFARSVSADRLVTSPSLGGAVSFGGALSLGSTTLSVAEPVAFELDVTVIDGHGRTGRARLALDPWVPVSQRVAPERTHEQDPRFVNDIDDRIERLRDELDARTLTVPRDLARVRELGQRIGELEFVLDGGPELTVAGVEALAGVDVATPTTALVGRVAESSLVDRLLGAGWDERE